MKKEREQTEARDRREIECGLPRIGAGAHSLRCVGVA